MQEVLTRDDSFNVGKAFEKILPLDGMFKYVAKFTNSIKVLKDCIISKLRFYTERMQTSLYSATQKYIGDCDEPKVIRNVYIMMTKIISHPIANIFVGEVSDIYIYVYCIICKILYLYAFFSFRRNHNMKKL